LTGGVPALESRHHRRRSVDRDFLDNVTGPHIQRPEMKKRGAASERQIGIVSDIKTAVAGENIQKWRGGEYIQ
jgi:hypothetical protein